MPFLLNSPVREQWVPYAFLDGALTSEQCDGLRAEFSKMQFAPAIVGQLGQATVDEKVRRSRTAWLEWSQDSDPLFRTLGDAALRMNHQWFGLHLSGFSEPLQITRYGAEDQGHYDAHLDWGPAEMQRRKLSLVLLLSDPGEFDGGALEFLYGTEWVRASEMKKGTLVAFPSFLLHRVTPLTRGERWSLVAWIAGPPFC